VLKVAIIIPCKNEGGYIAKCLDSVIAADYPGHLKQVFVCDGKSTDRTDQIAGEYCKKFPYIRLLRNENETTPHGLNLGIKEANADIIIILGAHAEMYPDYIKQCIACFESDQSVGCAGGIIENVFENETAHIISVAMSSSFGVGNVYFRTGGKTGYVDTVAFGAYKKEIFNKAGMFDTDLSRNQDDEFNFRVIKSGFRIYLSEKIKSKYYVRSSFKKLFRQYFQYGFWKVYVNKKHKTITTYRQLAPFFLLLFLIPGLFVSLLYAPFLKIYLALLIFYLLLILFFAVVNTNKARLIPGVGLAFLILHVSYGAGYAYGIIYFLMLNLKPIKRFSELSR
jgi:cellulose synthase/poly-beta-1,6-N-acetylglucosamine synthase-like glycosyltransferase